MSETNELDVLLLSALPLVKKNTKVKGEIDLVDQISSIRYNLLSSKKELRYMELSANRVTMKWAGTQRVKLMHLICHGSADNVIPVEAINSNFGVEDCLSQEDLRNLFINKPDVILLWSRHAKPVSKFLVHCGFQNIVACAYDYSTKGMAGPIYLLSAKFIQHFHEYLLKGHTIYKSFRHAHGMIGKDKAAQKIDIESKFRLLNCCDITPPPFFNLPDGTFNDATQEHTFLQGNFVLPAPVENFLGRNQSMFKVIEAVQKNRIPWVHGPEGFGKTAVITMTAHYYRRRGHFKNILYVDLANASDRTFFQKIGEAFHRRYWSKKSEVDNCEDTRLLTEMYYYQQMKIAPEPFSRVPKGISSEKEVFRALDKYTDTRFLLILDTIDFEKLDSKFVFEFLTQVVQRYRGKIMIILGSRVRKFESFPYDVQHIEIKKLGAPTCLRVLLHHTVKRFDGKWVGPEFQGAMETRIFSQLKEHPVGHLALVYHIPKASIQLSQIFLQSGQGFAHISSSVIKKMLEAMGPYLPYLSDQHYPFKGVNQKADLAQKRLLRWVPEALKAFVNDHIDDLNALLRTYNKSYGRHVAKRSRPVVPSTWKYTINSLTCTSNNHNPKQVSSPYNKEVIALASPRGKTRNRHNRNSPKSQNRRGSNPIYVDPSVDDEDFAGAMDKDEFFRRFNSEIAIKDPAPVSSNYHPFRDIAARIANAEELEVDDWDMLNPEGGNCLIGGVSEEDLNPPANGAGARKNKAKNLPKENSLYFDPEAMGMEDEMGHYFNPEKMGLDAKTLQKDNSLYFDPEAMGMDAKKLEKDSSLYFDPSAMGVNKTRRLGGGSSLYFDPEAMGIRDDPPSEGGSIYHFLGKQNELKKFNIDVDTAGIGRSAAYSESSRKRAGSRMSSFNARSDYQSFEHIQTAIQRMKANKGISSKPPEANPIYDSAEDLRHSLQKKQFPSGRMKNNRDKFQKTIISDTSFTGGE